MKPRKKPGAKPTGRAKKAVTFKLSPDVLAFLRAQTESSQAVAIERAVRATTSYRWWADDNLTPPPAPR